MKLLGLELVPVLECISGFTGCFTIPNPQQKFLGNQKSFTLYIWLKLSYQEASSPHLPCSVLVPLMGQICAPPHAAAGSESYRGCWKPWGGGCVCHQLLVEPTTPCQGTTQIRVPVSTLCILHFFIPQSYFPCPKPRKWAGIQVWCPAVLLIPLLVL